MTDVNLAPDWAQHFHDDNSNFAVGWKLYTYMSRTETYKPAYSDPAGTILHNPVITLNSRGEVPGMGLYLISGEAYTLELRDPLGVVKKTVHNIVVGGGASGGSSSTLLPSQTVLGNITAGTTLAYPVKIESDLQTASSDSNIPNVGAVLNELNDYLANSGNNIYDGNLEVTGNLEANSITINGVDIDDIFIPVDNHDARSVVGDITGDGIVEDIPLVNSIASESPNEIPSVLAVSTAIDNIDIDIQALEDAQGLVKVTLSDSLGYLEDKVTAGADISIVNSGTNLSIINDAPETFKTQASQYSTVKDFLDGVIEGTSGITVSVSANSNKIILSGAGIGGSGFTPRGAWDGVTTYDEGDGVWYYDSGVTPVINRYYVATATNTNIDPYTDGTGWVMMFSIDQLGDQLVKLDANDSNASFLLDKIVAGAGITFTRTVDAGGDFITIDGAPVWSIGVNGTDKTIADVSNTLDFVDGELIEVVWDGNNIKVNHDTFAESGTVVTQTATGLPKFDEYGHYKGENDAIEISDINGLETALTDVGDGKVSVDNSDMKGYLKNKLIAYGAVELFDVSYSPNDKKIQIVGTGKVATDNGDVVDYLENKVIAGDNVTINKVPHLNGESLEVSVNLPELDDDEPIIAEFGNPSSVYFPSNNSGSYIHRVAGKYTEFPMNTKRIENKAGGCFSTMNGVFSPEKEGYYVCAFNAYVHPSTSTSRNQPVYLSCSVEVSYDGTTWVDYGGSDSTRMTYIVFPSTGTSPEGYGKPMTFHMVVHLKDNQYSGKHMMGRIIITQGRFGAGYDNSVYFYYPQFAWYELKKPVGIQGLKGDTGTVTALGDIPDVDISGATDGQVLTYDDATSTWIPTTVSGGGADTYTVKVDVNDATPNYLSDKIVAAVNSPLTVNVVGDTLVLDAIESDITDPLIQTIGLMNENGTMGFTGNAYSSVYADGEWATGMGQNTSDAYYRVSTIGRGTINKVKFYVSAYNDVDNGIGPGNYGAIRIGLFTLDGVCKGATAWTRGLQTLGTNTLTMIPEAGQNLTLDRNGEYWIGIVCRGMQLISYNKVASGFDPWN